jgi:hypothetical protein
MIPIDVKDIIETVPLLNGFFLFQNDTGFYLGITCDNTGIAAIHMLDKAAYDCIKKREGKKL